MQLPDNMERCQSVTREVTTGDEIVNPVISAVSGLNQQSFSDCSENVSEGIRVLVACEFSGIVRDAFLRCGSYAVSCDLLPAEDHGPHIQGNVLALLNLGWDLLIAHPPCTHLSVSGARWFSQKTEQRREALDFVRRLMAAPIPHIAIENPVSSIGSHIRPADQMIQPWQFGHGETKATCFWLKNLPKLKPTQIVDGREARIHRMPPSPERSRERSRTYKGIAEAMADQWGRFVACPSRAFA